jgi:hypothetical protein
MARQPLFAVILEIPNEIAIPVELLYAAASSRAFEPWLAIHRLGGTKEMTIAQAEKKCSATAEDYCRGGVANFPGAF